MLVQYDQASMDNIHWGDLSLNIGQVLHFQYNQCRLWVKREHNEVWVASDYLGQEPPEAGHSELSDPSLWRRWALEKEPVRYNLQPRMPDKPIVVRPDSDFYLLPGAEARIYVKVPVWVRVKLFTHDKDEINLVKIPTEILSNTWFGSNIEGELCYWVSSNAIREYSTENQDENLCICPVQIKNISSEKLLVTKFCLRVNFLNIYGKGAQLWSNETKVFYKGPDEISEIKVTPGAPKEAEKADIITPSEELPGRSISVRTFGTLRGWYDKTSSLVSLNKLYNHFNGDK